MGATLSNCGRLPSILDLSASAVLLADFCRLQARADSDTSSLASSAERILEGAAVTDMGTILLSWLRLESITYKASYQEEGHTTYSTPTLRLCGADQQ